MHPFIEAYDTHCLALRCRAPTYTTGGGGGGGGTATESRGDELGSLRRQAVQRRGRFHRSHLEYEQLVIVANHVFCNVTTTELLL